MTSGNQVIFKATTAIAEAGTDDIRYMTAAKAKALLEQFGPYEPTGGLLSMYQGTLVSSGGSNEANSRGNVIIGPSAGAANGATQDPVPPTPEDRAIFDSVIIGSQAAELTKSGVGITAVGRYACQSAVNVGNNTGIGDSALRYCTTSQNTAVGYVSLGKQTSGQYNAALGAGTGHELLTGDNCTYVGYTAGSQNVSGDGCCAVGARALYNALGSNNCGFGLNAGDALVNGADNIFIGDEAGSTNTSQAGTCTNAIVIGANAFSLVSNRIVIGNSSHTAGQIFGTMTMHGAGNVNTNTIIGLTAALGVSGGGNTIYGVTAGSSLLAGSDNTAIGHAAMFSATTSIRNVSMGVSSLQSKVGGYGCTAVGWSSGSATTGDANTYVGYLCGNSITSGDTNTFIGNEAGNNASQLATASNSTAIGNGAYTTASNQIVLGNTSVTQTVTHGVLRARTEAAAPAGGGQAIAVGSTVGFGIYYGSGAPTAAASQGSLYMRTDGSGTSNRFYVNTDGGTTWTAVTTAS